MKSPTCKYIKGCLPRCVLVVWHEKQPGKMDKGKRPEEEENPLEGFPIPDDIGPRELAELEEANIRQRALENAADTANWKRRALDRVVNTAAYVGTSIAGKVAEHMPTRGEVLNTLFTVEVPVVTEEDVRRVIDGEKEWVDFLKDVDALDDRPNISEFFYRSSQVPEDISFAPNGLFEWPSKGYGYARKLWTRRDMRRLVRERVNLGGPQSVINAVNDYIGLFEAPPHMGPSNRVEVPVNAIDFIPHIHDVLYGKIGRPAYVFWNNADALYMRMAEQLVSHPLYKMYPASQRRALEASMAFWRYKFKNAPTVDQMKWLTGVSDVRLPEHIPNIDTLISADIRRVWKLRRDVRVAERNQKQKKKPGKWKSREARNRFFKGMQTRGRYRGGSSGAASARSDDDRLNEVFNLPAHVEELFDRPRLGAFKRAPAARPRSQKKVTDTYERVGRSRTKEPDFYMDHQDAQYYGVGEHGEPVYRKAPIHVSKTRGKKGSVKTKKVTKWPGKKKTGATSNYVSYHSPPSGRGVRSVPFLFRSGRYRRYRYGRGRSRWYRLRRGRKSYSRNVRNNSIVYL